MRDRGIQLRFLSEGNLMSCAKGHGESEWSNFKCKGDPQLNLQFFYDPVTETFYAHASGSA